MATTADRAARPEGLAGAPAPARDLWTTGIGTVRGQIDALTDLEQKVATGGQELRGAVADARKATASFALPARRCRRPATPA